MFQARKKMTVFNQVFHDSAFLFRHVCYRMRKRTKGLGNGEKAKGRTVNFESHSKHSLFFSLVFHFPWSQIFPNYSLEPKWSALSIMREEMRGTVSHQEESVWEYMPSSYLPSIRNQESNTHTELARVNEKSKTSQMDHREWRMENSTVESCREVTHLV